MPKNTGILEPEELNPSNPKHLFSTIRCSNCGKDHRLRLPYSEGISKIKFLCKGILMTSDLPLAWSPKQDSESYTDAEIVRD